MAARDQLKELRSRGMTMTAQQWAKFTPAQKRDILQQSRQKATKTRRAAQPEPQRRRNARRRADRYAQKGELKRKLDWRKLAGGAGGRSEEEEFWDRYREDVGIPKGKRAQ
jgi:hypothetical protein